MSTISIIILIILFFIFGILGIIFYDDLPDIGGGDIEDLAGFLYICVIFLCVFLCGFFIVGNILIKFLNKKFNKNIIAQDDDYEKKLDISMKNTKKLIALTVIGFIIFLVIMSIVSIIMVNLGE